MRVPSAAHAGVDTLDIGAYDRAATDEELVASMVEEPKRLRRNVTINDGKSRLRLACSDEIFQVPFGWVLARVQLCSARRSCR